MARRRSAFGGRSRAAPSRSFSSRPSPTLKSRAPAPARAPARAPAPAPKPVAAAPPPALAAAPSAGGGMMSGLASTVASGMAFGTGSAIAHRAVDSVMGGGGGGGGSGEPETTSTATVTAAPMSSSMGEATACQADMKAFRDCMAHNNDDSNQCKYFFEMLRQCQQSSRSFGESDEFQSSF